MAKGQTKTIPLIGEGNFTVPINRTLKDRPSCRGIYRGYRLPTKKEQAAARKIGAKVVATQLINNLSAGIVSVESARLLAGEHGINMEIILEKVRQNFAKSEEALFESLALLLHNIKNSRNDEKPASQRWRVQDNDLKALYRSVRGMILAHKALSKRSDFDDMVRRIFRGTGLRLVGASCSAAYARLRLVHE
jgi:hypothetical protein